MSRMTHAEMNGCGGHMDDVGLPLVLMLVFGILAGLFNMVYHAIIDEPPKSEVYYMELESDGRD